VTTEAVLTEATHLVGPSWIAQKACLEFLVRGTCALVPTTQESLRRIVPLMEKYRDVPMDYADATLVVLAEDFRSDQIFTLDRRGFSAYRTARGKAFHTLP